MLTSFNSTVPAFKNKNKLPRNEYTLINDINIFIEGSQISSKNILLLKNNRFYFDTADFEKILGFTVKITENNFSIDGSAETEKHFIHPFLTHNNKPFLSMIDLTEGLKLKVTWNYANKEIHFYKIRKEVPVKVRKQNKKPALIRLEDVSAGAAYTNSDNLQKMRIISDLMYSKGLPFHIAWIPRYKKPESNIDNDLLKVYSLSNVDFIYTLDYMIAKGGIVGLHGYTHQTGDEESGAGYEFGYKPHYTYEYTKNKVEAAVNTAKELDIPYEFFESPHYASSREQQKNVFENYFNYIFEPEKYLFNTIPTISSSNNKTIYVPAPLGYVQNSNVEDMIRRIKNKPKDHIAAMFYHPYIEFQYITLDQQSGYPEYNYSEDSILKKIIKCLDDENFALVKITDIKLAEKNP